MLETFTPAVCGSRKRQIVAQVLFALAAVVAAAALGLALGFLGTLLGARHAVYAAAALALVAAAREAGLLRFPLPQARRQVPERWRFELPLPVWATGYGAGLGAGFFTYQPVSTFWVACAGALALARPLPAAACFALYGAGRAAMVVWPRRRADDPTAAVERLARRRPALLRANAVVLVVCGILLAAAPTAGGATLVAQNAYDPSFNAGTLAFATQSGDVVVRPGGGGPDQVFPGASQPSVDGEYLAFRDDAGIAVVRWATGEVVARVDNPNASYPALDWPLLAFVRRDPSNRRLVLRNLEGGGYRVHASVKLRTVLGRPSLRSGRLAWSVASRKQSRIMLKMLASGKKRIVARSRIGLLQAPAVWSARIAWVDLRSGASHLRLGWVRAGRGGRTVETMKTRARAYWTTSLAGGTLYSTRWTLSSGASSVFRTGY
jgi:cytochrome c biogenesis protein CcdA